MEAAKTSLRPAKSPESSTNWSQKFLAYSIPRRGANYVTFSMIADGMVALTATVTANWLAPQSAPVTTVALWGVLLAIVLSRVFVFHASALYDRDQNLRLTTESLRVISANLIGFMVMLGIFYLVNMTAGLEWIAVHVVMALSLSLAWRLSAYASSYYALARSILRPRRVLLVGASEIGRELLEIIKQAPLPNMSVVGFMDASKEGSFADLPILGTYHDDIIDIIQREAIDEVIVTAPQDQQKQPTPVLMNLPYLPVPVRKVPPYIVSLYRSNTDGLEGLLQPYGDRIYMTNGQRLLKRLFDITVAGTALIAVLPLFGLIALCIWLYDRGPIFFAQERYGENARIFKMLKFRSMIVNADQMVERVMRFDADGKPVYKHAKDDRITLIGHVIRATSLDELPQLINIIRGDMSIVGPRPEVRDIVQKHYEPWQYERFRVPQGLTGWWQVNGRSEKECYKDTGKDIHYARNYSFWLDIKIILMTVPAVFKGNSKNLDTSPNVQPQQHP